MSNLRKLKRRGTSPLNMVKRSQAPVLIVRPHNPEGKTEEKTHNFLSFNFGNRIADIRGRGSKVPETARNKYIEEFLNDKEHAHRTHMFFLDDDSPPLELDAIVKLLAHRKPVICAPTPIFRYDYELQHIMCYWNTQGKLDDHTEEEPKFEVYDYYQLPKNKLFKCYRTGGTGLLIRRDVLEKLKPPYQVTTYNETFTDVTVSEDTYFSDKIRKAGYEIWADGNTVCRHIHNIDILDIVAMLLEIRHEKKTPDDPLYKSIINHRLKNIVKDNESIHHFVNMLK